MILKETMIMAAPYHQKTHLDGIERFWAPEWQSYHQRNTAGNMLKVMLGFVIC